MFLYVMRHGPAEDRAPSGRDVDRELSRVGREVVARSARALHAARQALDPRPRPLRVLASPARRARETAEIVATATVPPLEVELHDDLAVDGPFPRELLADLTAAGTDALLVGHQPSVENLVDALLHPTRSALPSGFRTGMVVALERVAENCWHQAALLDPYQVGS